MQKKLLPFQKIIIFLYFLESLIIIQSTFKIYFWILILMFVICSYIYQGARFYTPVLMIIAVVDYFEFDLLQTLFVIISTFIVYAIRFYDIPTLDKGPYNAGYKYYKHESIELAVFYPAMSGGTEANWYPGNKYDEVFYDIYHSDVDQSRIPFQLFNFIMSFSKKAKMPVGQNAPLYKIDGKNAKNKEYKLIIFSHGLGSNMNHYSALCGWWATHGYIVICVQHYRDTIRIQYKGLTGGRNHLLATQEQIIAIERHFYQSRNADIQVRSKEMRFIYNQIINQHLLQKIFAEEIDIHQVYLAGHSFGAGTALETMADLIRAGDSIKSIKGLICLDPWLFPLSESTYESLKNQNLLIINSQSFIKKLLKIYDSEAKLKRIVQSNTETIKAFYVKESNHLDPTDIVFVFGNVLEKVNINRNHHFSKEKILLQIKVIEEFMKGASKKDILLKSNQTAQELRLDQLGIYVCEEDRLERSKWEQAEKSKTS